MEKMNEIDAIKGRNIADQEYYGILNDNTCPKTDKRIFKLYKDPSEKKYQNIKNIIYREHYDKSFRECKNLSYRLNTSKKKLYDINNLYKDKDKDKENKKRKITKSHSQIEDQKNNNNKSSFINEGIEICFIKKRPI